MKNKIVYGILLIILTITGLFISSCEITDPVDGLEVRINTYTRETLVSSYVYDANTLKSVPEKVQITFTGEDASLIVDETNEPKTTFTAKNGIFIFGVADGTEISTANPINVSILLEAKGYNTETAILKISKPGNQTKNLFMISPETLPQNSDSETFDVGSANNSGALEQDVQHTTAKGTNISLTGGTVIKKEDGTPLSGKLKMNLTSIPLTSENRYNAPREMITSGNELISPLMKLNLSVTDGSGNSADNFSESLSFNVIIPEDLAIPIDGSIITVWKENRNSGLWENVGEVTYSSSANSKNIYISSGSLDGTSSEAGALILGTSSQVCTATITINNLPSDFNSTIQFFDSNASLIGATNNSTLEIDIDDSGIEISSVRINADLDDPLNTGIELGSNFSIGCGTNNIELNFPAELMSVQCEIIGICTAKDPAVVVNPNISFSYRKVGASTWQSNNLVNGIAVVTGLEIGANYEITATYRGQTGNAIFEIVSAQDINIVEVSNPENLLSSSVSSSTTPPKLFMEIDIEDECE